MVRCLIAKFPVGELPVLTGMRIEGYELEGGSAWVWVCLDGGYKEMVHHM